MIFWLCSSSSICTRTQVRKIILFWFLISAVRKSHRSVTGKRLNTMLTSFRVRPTWLALAFCSVVILGCIRTILFYPDPETGVRNDLELILDGISVTDLISMVFWEKNNVEDLESEILLEKSQGLRDQESFNYNSLKIFLRLATKNLSFLF